MRIISKFHDYYDGVQAFGQDQTLIYLRKQEIIEKDSDRDISIISILQRSESDFSYYGFIVYFCGKSYPGVRFVRHENATLSKPKERFCYTIEQCREFAAANGFSLSGYSGWGGSIDYRLQEFFKDPQERLAPFQNHKCPIMVSGWRGFYSSGLEDPLYRYGRFANLSLKNPCLRSLEFFRVIDANQAFQTIAGFLSGVLGVSTPPMVAVSEKTRIKKRGFDEWSFRKLPTKKKRK